LFLKKIKNRFYNIFLDLLALTHSYSTLAINVTLFAQFAQSMCKRPALKDTLHQHGPRIKVKTFSAETRISEKNTYFLRNFQDILLRKNEAFCPGPQLALITALAS